MQNKLRKTLALMLLAIVVTTTMAQETPRDLLRNLYAAGLRFAVENREFARMGSHFMRAAPELKREIFGEYRDLSQQFIQSMLQKGQEGGEYDREMDIAMAGFILHSSSQALMDQLVEESPDENVFEKPEDYWAMADRMLTVVERGLLSQEARRRRGLEVDG